MDWLLFQILNFIGSSVIYLSLSEIPIWTHQRQFGLNLGRMTNMQHIHEETIKSVQFWVQCSKLKLCGGL